MYGERENKGEVVIEAALLNVLKGEQVRADCSADLLHVGGWDMDWMK